MTDAAPPTDPYEMMRLAYDQAIENWAMTMEQVVSSEEFASASGQFLKRYVEMQESMRTASQATAESLHIPTIEDIARVAELVINVERKVDEVSDEADAVAKRLASMEATLDELARRPAPASEKAAAAEVAAVAERLASIETKLDELVRRPAQRAAEAAPAPKKTAPAPEQKAPAAKRAPARRRAQAPTKG